MRRIVLLLLLAAAIGYAFYTRYALKMYNSIAFSTPRSAPH